jgi:hypothetical protein
MSDYKYNINPEIEAVLKRGPVSVENCMKILFFAAQNPAIQLHNIPSEMMEEVLQKIQEELSTFSEDWQKSFLTYPSPMDAFQEMQAHRQLLLTVYNFLLSNQFTMKLLKRSYLPRFSDN